MTTTHLLTKLNPKIGTYAQTVAPVTGDRIEPMDMAAALAGLPANAYYLGRYVFAGDESCYPDVLAHAMADVEIVSHIRHWRLKTETTLQRLIKLGLYEIVQERLCTRCKGREWFSHNCPVCEGSGRLALSNYQRAKYAGMDRKLWNQCWGERYERHVFRYLLALLHLVRQHLQRRLVGC